MGDAKLGDTGVESQTQPRAPLSTVLRRSSDVEGSYRAAVATSSCTCPRDRASGVNNYSYGYGYAVARPIKSPYCFVSLHLLPVLPSFRTDNLQSCVMAPSEAEVMGEPSVQLQHLSGEECQVTIDMLPDEVLLEIFDFCRELSTGDLDGDLEMDGPWRWGTLWWWTFPVHVCRRWRNIIFESSRRLDLRVTCDREPLTLMRETLDIWPPFPITLHHQHGIGIEVSFGNCEEGLLAALEHQDRIAEIDISNLLDSDWEIIIAAMHKPLPALKRLIVHQYRERRTLPETLGVSAPQLRSFSSSGFSFRALPNFVSSASDIVDLQLLRIPHSGYIAPDMVVTWLEALPKLKHFSFGFHSIESRPIQ
ncbi:hypothetical protein F5148DRAFT_1377720 [Russula earlei]|uniref:Uncharacterized protein n=1 Tax=Russula earlei TaxID=71964 RepID=A0ACC0U1J0_9AGAM|nr:hypothetical protein F5148DRAFT_1377720 [Russula earlei]